MCLCRCRILIEGYLYLQYLHKKRIMPYAGVEDTFLSKKLDFGTLETSCSGSLPAAATQARQAASGPGQAAGSCGQIAGRSRQLPTAHS